MKTRALISVVVAALLAMAFASSAAAGRGGNGKGPHSTKTPTLSSDVLAVHDATCPQVVEYTDCSTLSVTVSNFGPTGWIGSSGPAAGTVSYNTYYNLSSGWWAQTVSHEVGGHHDAWNEIVAKVGEAQAWTDYYDLDYFGELWAEARYEELTGTQRDFTRSEGKEAYLDCAGPVEHGYTGNYLSRWGVGSAFCTGYEQVMADALTEVRPS